MHVRVIGAVLATLVAAAPAAHGASGLAQVIGPDGRLVSTASAQAGWAYPADGAVAQVADLTVGSRSVRLRGITLLRGRVTIDTAVAGPDASTTGLVIDGRPVTATNDNTVIAIPGAGWALLQQEAVIPLRTGRVRTTHVAVRLHLLAGVAGVPAGTDVLIGYVAGRGGGTRLTGAAAEIPASLVPVYRAASHRYGVPWSVLAAINRVETSFGQNLSTSSAGAVGWMQFMPATWAGYGVDANGDGRVDPYAPADAIFAAANLLSRNGASRDLRRAVFQYNHAWWYVDQVLALAGAYADGASTVPVALDAPRPGEDEDGALYSPIALW